MPSTYAHYRMGRWVLRNLPKPVCQKITPYRELYDIGLHGPDILFYYRPLAASCVSSAGYELHHCSGKDFFERAACAADRCTDPQAGFAYICGLLCHYALDSTCHGYINEYEKKRGITHAEIETEFDRCLLVSDGCDPLSQSLTDHIVPSAENAEIIAAFYDMVSPEEIRRSLSSMIRCSRLLLAPRQPKRAAVCGLMTVSGRYAALRGLMVNRQPNPDCAESCSRLSSLYTEASMDAIHMICSFPHLLADKGFEKRLSLTFDGENRCSSDAILKAMDRSFDADCQAALGGVGI